MPQIQMLEKIPGFGERLGQALGSGLSHGIVERLQQHAKQKQFEAAGLPSVFANLDPAVAKELIKQQQRSKLIESIMGTSNPAEQTNSTEQPYIEKKGSSPEQIQALSLVDPNLARITQSQEKMKAEEKRAGLKDTSKFRTSLVEKSESAKKGIRNKEQLIKLAKKGNLDNPMFVAIADRLPRGFRESLLSNDSLAYESGLFEEFGVLRNMFPGQIRVAEIQLLEPKLASLFKNNEAKERILKAGIESLESDVIRARAAAEVEKENPGLNLLTFQDAVEKKAAPKLQELYNKIENELKEIADRYAPEVKMKNEVEVIDSNGKHIGFINRSQVKELPKGYTYK